MNPPGAAVRPGAAGLAVRGGVLIYVGALVVLPLAALLQHGLAGGLGGSGRP